MKIGVDARLLSKSITGIGRYTLEMCRALSAIDGIILYLYSPSSINLDIQRDLASALFKTSDFDNICLWQVWSELHLPWWIARDEVDIFWGPAHRLPVILPQKIARIVTIHDLVWKYYGETMRPFSRWLEAVQSPSAINRADHIVTISQATATSVSQEFNIKTDRITPILCGANHLLAGGDLADLENYGLKHPYFLFVGTLEPRKNLINLLAAYSKLPLTIKKKVKCVIVGGQGWGNINLEKTISELELTEHVLLLGYVSESVLATLYTHAQFLAMPSLYEGFGLPLVEAMSRGIPVLTSNNSSMIEVAQDSGILVDPFDVESIKKGLLELISNDDMRATFSKRAKLNASQFKWQFSADQMVNIFRKAIEYRKSLLQ